MSRTYDPTIAAMTDDALQAAIDAAEKQGRERGITQTELDHLKKLHKERTRRARKAVRKLADAEIDQLLEKDPGWMHSILWKERTRRRKAKAEQDQEAVWGKIFELSNAELVNYVSAGVEALTMAEMEVAKEILERRIEEVTEELSAAIGLIEQEIERREDQDDREVVGLEIADASD